MLLAKQKEAGKALMAEDDRWLNLTDNEEEEDAHAHLCFMAKRDEKYNSDNDDRLSCNSESMSEVYSASFTNFEEQINSMMFKIQEFRREI